MVKGVLLLILKLTLYYRFLEFGIIDKNGYIKIRNNLLHGGFEASVKYAKILNKDFIEGVILDIVNFAHKVDLNVVVEYPDDEFPQIYMK